MSEARVNKYSSSNGGVPAITFDGNTNLVERYRQREALIASFVLSSGNWQGDWATITVYAADDIVVEGGLAYICITPHTSGDFATDLDAGKWEEFTSKESRIFIPATRFRAVSGSPAETLIASRHTGYAFDAASTETISVSPVVPANWGAFTSVIYWTNLSTGSGDVYWQLVLDALANNENLAVAGDSQYITPTAPSENYLKLSAFSTEFSDLTPRDLIRIEVSRIGGDAADTLGNDAGFLGLELIKV